MTSLQNAGGLRKLYEARWSKHDQRQGRDPPNGGIPLGTRRPRREGKEVEARGRNRREEQGEGE